MAVRINKAKNFKGKAYVAADELDSLIKSMTFAGGTIPQATGNSANDWVINFTNIDGTPATTSAVDLTSIKDYIDNKAITVEAGAGITINTSNVLQPKISADVDGTTIILSGEGNAAKIAANLSLKKRTSANTGYAASYYLAYGDSTEAIGTDINIVKDQFLKNVELGYGTFTNSDTAPVDWTTTKTGNLNAILKLTFAITKTEGDAQTDSSSTATDDDKVVYINVDGMFHDKTAGNGISTTDLNSNVITVVADGADVVYTAANTSNSVVTVGATGVKVSGVQAAINYAVDDEHAKASAAISSVDAKVNSLASATSTAVEDLNTRISAVAGNAQTAVQTVGAAVDTLDGNLQTAIANVNTNVETAIDSVVTNVNTAISANISNVNGAVTTAVGTVNAKVDEAVSSVNAQVGAFKGTVSATIEAEQGAVSAFLGSVNTVISAVEANRTTQLANAVQMVESNVTVGTGAVTSGTASVTVTANNIVAVYDPQGTQIYPDITRSGATAPYTYTLEAEYGEATPDASWTVLCTLALPAYTDAGDVAYTAGANTVAYTNADDGTDASYSDVDETDVVAVDAPDVEYTASADVDGTTVGAGDPATAPTVPSAVTIGALDYTGHNA